jgi:hypothetical protein
MKMKLQVKQEGMETSSSISLSSKNRNSDDNSIISFKRQKTICIDKTKHMNSGDHINDGNKGTDPPMSTNGFLVRVSTDTNGINISTSSSNMIIQLATKPLYRLHTD